MSTSSSAPDKLLGADHDVLIPTPASINRIFHEGRETWMQFVRSAESLPPGTLPAGLGDPSIMLKDVPALPEKLPKTRTLVGQPVWNIPSPEQDEEVDAPSPEQDGSTHWNPDHVYGVQKSFCLSFSKPVECRLSSRPDFFHFGKARHQDGHRPSTAPRGLWLLTLCWSYIISARFLELQDRGLRYSRHFLRPRVVNTFCPGQDDLVLHLGAFASRGLIRWLCALLAPKPGWSADGGDFPPWAAFLCGGDTRLILSTDEPVVFASDEGPPSSAEATELLVEFCSLYGLGPKKRGGQMSGSVSPFMAAFLAALALPFYRCVDLQPQLPVSTFSRRNIDSVLLQPIRQYVADIRYYMTLSMDPETLGSVIWSIFWQPEVECNLVSPWLGSILSVIKPIIDSRDVELLAKTFALRRPRVALWWLGVFLLGNPAILDWIGRYLETAEERWGYASMAPPDIAAAAWTGSPQSFLDERPSRTYMGSTGSVSRADVLRCRYNFRLQDTASTPLAWKPFGKMAWTDVEPDLWPWLRRGCVREYVHWIWWIKKSSSAVADVQLGFQRDTGRFVADVPDRLKLMRAGQPAGCSEAIKLAPSRESTLRMIHYCLEDISGDRDIAIAAMPGVEQHPWLKYWRGLE